MAGSSINIAVMMLALTPADGVVIQETEYDGIACFRVVTPSAVYTYDKAGAAFASILDRDGLEWIGFHPRGTPGLNGSGTDGWFRGIPNLSDDFGHPGSPGAVSTTPNEIDVPLPSARIESTKDGWNVSWEFFVDHAHMIIHSAGASYWLLFEGTPGGEVDGDDISWRSRGEGASASTPWDGDVAPSNGVPGQEWVYFAAAEADRSLFLAHNDDTITDTYYPLGAMTVFGFGRRANWSAGLLDCAPATLSLGLVESRDFDDVENTIAAVLSVHDSVPCVSPSPPNRPRQSNADGGCSCRAGEPGLTTLLAGASVVALLLRLRRRAPRSGKGSR